MSLFGQTQQKPNLFGSFGGANNASTAPAAPQPVFGSTAPTGGGSIFGAPKPATNIFGGTTNQPAAPIGGLFGSATAAPASNMFGAKPAGLPSLNTSTANQSSNIFANAPPAAPAGNTSGFFSQPNQQQQPQQQQQQATNPFGQQAAPLMPFGAPAPPTGPNQSQASSSIFGGQRPANASTTQFAPTSSLFGPSRAPLTTSQLTMHQPAKTSPEQQLQQKIEEIAQAWNPSSPQCKFQHYFYNIVEPEKVGLFGKPANVDQAKWDKALRDRPDPSCMVPVLAIGFDDIQKRAEAQKALALQSQEKLKELRASLSSLSQAHVLQNTLRLQRLQVLQTQLSHKLLRFVQHLHLLIPTVRSSSIRPEEEGLGATLEAVEEELRKPGGGVGVSKMRAKLNELWAVVGQLQAVKEGEKGRDIVGWQVVDPEGLQRIAHVLIEEHQGLAYLTQLIQADAKALTVLEEGTASGKFTPAAGRKVSDGGGGGGGYRSVSGLSSSFLSGRSHS